jgi:hypothetical protein
LVQARDGRVVDTHTARVEVAEIPYLRLRDQLFSADLGPTTGFGRTIEQIQQTLDSLPNLPTLVIVPAARHIRIGETAIPLQPLELVLYAQFAQARIQQSQEGDGFLNLEELDRRRPAMLRRYEQLYGTYSVQTGYTGDN